MRNLLPRFRIYGAAANDDTRDVYREAEGYSLTVSWLGFWVEFHLYGWDAIEFPDEASPR
jgi:hypothetical protein